MANLIGTTITSQYMAIQGINDNWRLADSENNQFLYHKNASNSSLSIFDDYSALSPTTNTAIGYYMVIGTEIIEITNVFPHNGAPDVYQVFFVNRGVGGTTAVGHGFGEEVQIWDGLPPGGSAPDTETDQSDIPPEIDEELPDVELGNFENQMGVVKQLFFNKPNVGNLSQYNFNNTNNINYLNSNGLPQPYDKFQDKDLFTTTVGSKINEDIIEKNLKFAGNPSIKIENIYVANAGVDGTVKNNKVKIYMFSEAAYGGDPTEDGYSTVKSKMDSNSSDWKIYDESFGNQSEGTDIGNLDKVEGVDIISNFDSDSAQISIGDIPGRELDIDASMPDDTKIPSKIAAFKLSDILDVPNLKTSIFNQQSFNPIYIVVLTTGDKKVAWPVKTDSRKKKYSIYKISNEDLFIKTGDIFTGTNYLVNFPSPSRTRTGEGGGGATASAWKVTSLQIRINTLPGVKNDFSEASNYQNSISQVLPAVTINKEIFNSVEWLSLLNPKNQLDNKQSVEYRDATSSGANRHIDFFPFTTLGYSQINNQLSLASVDLQSYYNDLNDIVRSSAPLNVTFKFDIRNLDGAILPEVLVNGNREYYYFVIDWDDRNDKFKTIQDWLESKPENEFDYLELQNQNLYTIFSTTDSTSPNNVYTTPGIKNLKVIMFSVFNGDGTEDSPDFEVGRWKLITSRFYLDISPNKYPDFSNVGGADYTTIPWPYTTVIIGGVSETSKYKKSAQDTLSGGKIGEFDFIDERFLINDSDNDELGKSIKSMDLEQCRYFNTGSYNMYDLLGIDAVIDDELIQYNNPYYDGETNKFPEESSVGQIFITDNQDKELKQNCKLELNAGQITGKTLLDTSGNSNKGMLIGDYKIKKVRKGETMRRDSFIKVPKKTGNTRGAL